MNQFSRFLLVLLLCWISSALSIAYSPLAAQEKIIRVALFIDEGTEASEFRKEFRRNTDTTISYQKVNGADIASGILRNFDALVIPGGSASTESYSIGPEGRQEIRRFVRDGGIYLGVCAGAYLASRLKECYLGMLPLKTYDEAHWYRTAGAPLVDVELTPAGMEIFGIKEKNVQIVYEDGPIFAPPFETPDPSFTPLGFFRSEVVAPGGQRGVMIGAPAMIYSKYGRGSILVISPHPEETPGMKQVELHALRWLYDHRNEGLQKNVAINAGEVPYSSASKQTDPEQTSSRQLDSRQVDSHQLDSQKLESKRLASQQIASQAFPSEQAATQQTDAGLSRLLLEAAMKVFEEASIVRYDHNEVSASRQIEFEPDGTVKALTDCSGFVSYIVHKVAPRHYTAVRSREPQAAYPQAKIWARFFGSLLNDGPSDGWLGISDWRTLQAGDIIAWKTGEEGAKNTGHVMIVKGKPGQIQEERGFRYVEIPVIDSSSVYHFKPEYLPPRANQTHRNGLGCGSVRLVLSDDDKAIGYWEGSYWGEGDKPVEGPTYSKIIHFARLIPLAQTAH